MILQLHTYVQVCLWHDFELILFLVASSSKNNEI